MKDQPNYYAQKVYDLTADVDQSLEPRKILMLEDNVEFSRVLREALESYNFKVDCVANGVEGLKRIMAEDFDIIICDMMMPHLPGDMFYLAVEKTKPQLCKRFIFISGHRADPRWDAFIRKVKGVMLWKPFPMPDILTAIQNVLKKS